jgi:uncharacterized protein YjaG (DUF416 family)
VLVFDSDRIRAELSALELRARAVFGACAAERLHPFYSAYVRRVGLGSVETLRSLLDALWSQLVDGQRRNNDYAMAQALTMIPEEDPPVAEQPHAEDAVTALVYAFGALENRDPKEAIEAVQRAYDSADHHVSGVLGLDDERDILEHPVVQDELRRQRRDLDDLIEHPLTPELVDMLRSRARADAGLGIVDSGTIPHG